jgi:hypothetical protein
MTEDLRLHVRHFATVIKRTEALCEFRRRSKRERLIERHGFRTPSQARGDSCARSKGLDFGSRCRRFRLAGP